MSQDMEARLQALEAKIQDLSDREAIRSLRFRYHECINEGNWKLFPICSLRMLSSILTIWAKLPVGPS